MKKISIFLVAMLVAVSASAQLVTSSSAMKVKQPKEDRTTWVFRAGIGVTNMPMSDNIYFGNNDSPWAYGDDASGKLGYMLDWSFNRKMGNQGAYWGMGWTFGNRGYKLDKNGYKRSLLAHNFQYTPFMFGWKIQCGSSKISIDPHMSVYLAIDYIGKVKFEGDETYSVQYTESVPYTGYGGYTYYRTETKTRYETRHVEDDWSIWDESDYMPFDVGLKFGIGVWFNDKFNIDLSYQRGFMPAYSYENLELGDGPLTSNFIVSVGVGF